MLLWLALCLVLVLSLVTLLSPLEVEPDGSAAAPPPGN
jgi:hypothetical protein